MRKIAKIRKDKLGPQWASWVGKAVKKLVRLNVTSFRNSLILSEQEEQGVLQPIDSSGYVGMTPEGKKV